MSGGHSRAIVLAMKPSRTTTHSTNPTINAQMILVNTPDMAVP